MIERVGQQLGNYRLQRLVGRGGFADVYLGEHTYLHKPAALKLLHLHLDEHDAEQFLHEAQTLARLDHPHIVRVLDFAVQNGLPYLVMDYAVGGTLRTKHPAGTRVPLEHILSYVSQVASALQYAHDQRIMHRDIKPENLLLDAHEQVWLSDFGLALLTPTHSASTQAMDPAMAGTAAYLAPEQVQGQPRPASDQYALAVVVYEWLTGQRPFTGTPIEVAMQHVSAAPPPFHEQMPDLPPAVEEVVMRALAKEPEQRFPSVQDFATALQHAAHPTGDVYITPSMPATSTSPATPVESLRAEPFWKVPTSLTSLIGREQDVASVCTMLSRSDVRLLTLMGVGGIGKTRLSIQVATQLRDRFADGVCFVNLAPLSDPSLVISTIAHELGLQEAGAQPLVETFKAWLRDKHFLLLLDNFEHIVNAAPLLEDLLAACPQLVILVTSREVLRLSAEHLFPVPSLTLPDLAQLPEQEDLEQCAAVSLFLQRAQALKPDFMLTPANARAIAEICVRLDGLPLAIELAAARIRVLPPHALLTRLSQRLQVLTSGSRTLPARQQTLRNTIQWSYDLLNTEEQRLFRRLSVFVGGCSLEGAAAVCNASGDLERDLLDGVTSLLDKSLLLQTEQEGEEPRLLLLETIREFGLECLAASEEGEATRRAHTAYYLALAEEAEQHLYSAEAVNWFERLEREQGNHRAALLYALEREEEVDMAVRLGSALCRFWTVRGHLSEGRTLLEQVFTKSLRSTASVRGQAIYALVMIVWYQGDYVRAEQLATEGLLLARQLGKQRFMAAALFVLAGVALYQRNYPAAHSLGTEALAVARASGETWWMANILFLLGRLASAQGDQSRAQPLIEESLALYRTLGYQGDIGWPLIYLARNCITQGDLARARTLLEEAMTLCQEGDYTWGQAQAVGFLGQVALAQGDVSRAHALLTESLRLNQELGNQHSVAWSLFHLASTVGLQGDTTTARSLYRQGLDLALALRYQRLIVACLEGLAIVATAQGQLTQAARLWGAAEVFLQESRVALPTGLRPYSERAQASARAQLGEAAFDAALAEGRTMPLEQVITQGVETKDAPLTEVSEGVANQEEASSDLPPGILSRRALKQHFGGLTAREREVARLVAQGKSNRAVADELVIGVSTVEAHITHIFTKLGFSSRAQIAAWAVEKGLTKAPQDLGVPRQKH